MTNRTIKGVAKHEPLRDHMKLMNYDGRWKHENDIRDAVAGLKVEIDTKISGLTGTDVENICKSIDKWLGVDDEQKN